MESKGAPHRAIFFDRDGTLNVDTGYLYKPEDFRWIEGAPAAIRWANDHGYLVIVITNQSGVARGYYEEAAVEALHCWMNEELKGYGAHIDAFYYCPHHPEGQVARYAKACACRKPGAKLVEDACRDFAIDRKASLLIGDAQRDLDCAARAGIPGLRYSGGSLLDLLRVGLVERAGELAAVGASPPGAALAAEAARRSAERSRP